MATDNPIDSMQSLFQTAVSHYQSGNLQAAESLLKAMPGDPDALHLLSIIFCRQGQYELALDHLTRAIGIKPEVADYHAQRGIAYSQLKKWEEAATCFRQALELQPALAPAHNNLGTMLKELGRFNEAATAFENAILLKPDYALAHNNLGNIFREQGKAGLAAQCFSKALALKPDYVDAHHNLGNALENLGQLEEAAACYQALLASGDHTVRTYNNLGNVYAHQGKPSEAVALLQHALALDRDTAETYCNLGYALFIQGKLSEAVDNLNQAINLKPDLAMAYLNLSGALCGLGKYEEAIASIRKAMAIKPNDSEAYSNLLFVSQFLHTLAQSILFDEHLRFAERFETPVKSTWREHPNPCDAAKRLKIGYVSADFRSHAVATFIEPVLGSHDKSQFEIFCYYNHTRHDAVTDRIQARAEHWLTCVGLNDDQLAERIRSDGIDVLVDLSGHTGGNRLLTFARKPAPVQLTYLGYPGTSGLSAMDYRITDAYADPEGCEQYYSEQLLRLPDSLCCYRPGVDMPEVSPLPALKSEFLTFGSFNNSSKIDQRTIALWAEILGALPLSRLFMAATPEGDRREWIARQFEDAGVARDRIDFHGTVPAREFHDLFQRVDIALDPLLITGGTTTCESLWMGVPVIVLVGQRFIHRVGYSFLCSAGLRQYAAATPEEYVGIAVAAASDIPKLAQLRTGMRAQLATSPLMDQARFTRNLENAYRNAWQTWCGSAT